MIPPTKDDVGRVLNWCLEADSLGSHHPSMTYEEGVEAAIHWMLGETDEAPDAE